MLIDSSTIEHLAEVRQQQPTRGRQLRPRPRGTAACSACAPRAGRGQPCSRPSEPSSATPPAHGSGPNGSRSLVPVDRRHRELGVTAVEPVLQQDEQEAEQREDAGERDPLSGADRDVLDRVQEALAVVGAGPLPLPAGPESWLPLVCGVCESPEGVSVTAGDFVFGFGSRDRRGGRVRRGPTARRRDRLLLRRARTTRSRRKRSAPRPGGRRAAPPRCGKSVTAPRRFAVHAGIALSALSLVRRNSASVPVKIFVPVNPSQLRSRRPCPARPRRPCTGPARRNRARQASPARPGSAVLDLDAAAHLLSRPQCRGIEERRAAVVVGELAVHSGTRVGSNFGKRKRREHPDEDDRGKGEQDPAPHASAYWFRASHVNAWLPEASPAAELLSWSETVNR